MKPLPQETILLLGKDFDITVTVSASITSEDDLKLSLGHSLRGIYEDITKYLVYNIYEEKAGKNEKGYDQLWKIDMTLPFIFSEDLGHLILSIGDNHSGGITTSRLVVGEERKLVKPFFDPVPKDVTGSLGEDMLIETQIRGSTPIEVNLYYIF